MREVRDRKGKLHSEMAMLEVNLESEIRGGGIIRNIPLPLLIESGRSRGRSHPTTHGCFFFWRSESGF